MNRAISALHGRFGRACLYAQTRPMAVHAHREGHLIFHLGGQAASFDVAGEPCVCGPGSAVAVDPFEPHQVSYRPDEAECLMLALYIEPEWFAGFDADAPAALRFGCPAVEITAGMRALVDTIASSLPRDARSGGRAGRRVECSRDESADGRNEPCAGIVLETLLHDLCRLCHARSWRGSRRPPPPCLPSGVSDPRVRKSTRLLERSVGEAVSLDAVAREVGLSRPHFFKLFRENVGVTPNLYLNTFRTERAIERLVGSTQPITSIGLDLGFASQASFTRFFGANAGIPPTGYRRVAQRA